MRQFRGYKKSEERVCPDYTRLRQTITPTVDKVESVRFDITPPADSHMFSSCYLTRTFKVELVNRAPRAWRDSGDSRVHRHDDELTFYINQTGFALQNTCESMRVQYNSTYLKSKPKLWVPWYSKLYQRSLNQSAQTSGRGFYSTPSSPFSKYNQTIRGIDTTSFTGETDAVPFELGIPV